MHRADSWLDPRERPGRSAEHTGPRRGDRGSIEPGDCVQLPDGRIGRVRDRVDDGYRVRVRRATSKTHQFLVLNQRDLRQVDCPPGWMSPEGYNRYLRVTLEKMRQRQARRA